MKKTLLTVLFCVAVTTIWAQPIPSKDNNIDFLQTFGNKAPATWGDDDYVQTFFVALPFNYKQPFYIRVFDANCGGEHDQVNGTFNTKTKYTIYGGNSAYSNEDARNTNPIGNYKSGVLLHTKVFDSSPEFDNNWYTFGPINPSEGEVDKDLNAHVFKIIAEGISGDDGNMYSYYVSSSAIDNKPIEGLNAFAYEISFRMQPKAEQKQMHLYPFIDNKIVSVTQNNFDFDNLGFMRLTSINKKVNAQEVSLDGIWAKTTAKITVAEHNTSLDYCVINTNNKANDAVLFFVNQYGKAIPFFTSPIGGLPKYKYKINVSYDVE
ncbi:MAG: hypothetical protein H7331_10430 [Bacteroidia bacterium]|nr:hypothetical protein [Bacteroidia bacterium]